MANQHTGLNVPNSRVHSTEAPGPVSSSTAHAGFDDSRLEDEIDFGSYARFLIRYSIALVVCAAAGAVAGFLVAERRPTLYEAATTILARQGDAPVNIGAVRALVQNGTLASQVLRETGLDSPPGTLSPQAFIADAVRVDEVPGTNFLKMIVTLPDPGKAAIASTTLARKAVDLSRQVSHDEGLAFRGRVKDQLEAAAQRLAEAEQRLLSYQNEAQVEVLRTDTESMLDQRTRLLKLLVDIDAEKGKLATAEQDIRNHKPTLSLRRSTASEQALRRAAGAENPPAADSPVTTVDPETLDLTEPFVNPIHQTLALQIAMSRIRLAGLERERDRILSAEKLGRDRLSRLTDLHRRELELARLKGDYDLAKQVHAGLAVRYEQAPMESLNRMMILQVVDEAIPPDRPKAKPRTKAAALGAASAFVLAALAAMAWESVRTSRLDR